MRHRVVTSFRSFTRKTLRKGLVMYGLRLFGLLALLLFPGFALAQGGPGGGGGPGPSPTQPWLINGGQIYYNNGCVTVPSTVVGGCKPGSSINATTLWQAGNQALDTSNLGTSGATIPRNNTGFTQSGTANFTGAFQINGNVITWPSAAITVARIDAAQSFAGLQTFSRSIVVGAPTSGDQGIGTLNATGLFINGIAVSTSAANLTVGSSTISSGSPTRVLYDAAGILGEYAISGSGSVCMTTNCSLTTPTIGAAIGTSLALGGATLGSNTLAVSGPTTLSSTSAAALSVGANGATNPALLVDASTASSATGIKIKSAAAASGVAVSVITSGTNENLAIDAAGSGTITFGATSTGAIIHTRATTLSAALTYGGVTLANTVTGTGSMVASISPTITGHMTVEGVTATGATGTGNFVFATAPSVSSLTVTTAFTATGLVAATALTDGFTGSGAFVRATNATLTTPSIGSPTITTSFTATGLVKNADLVNASTTVNGQTCTLGSTCTITATAASITVGTTTVSGGPGVLYNSTSGGTLTAVSFVNNAVMVTNGSGVPSFSTTLPSSLAATSLTCTTCTLTGGTATGLTTLAIRDTSAAFDVTLAATSSTTLTAGRTLTLNMGNVAHTLAFGTTANTITFPNLASFTVITNGDTGTVTNAMLANSSVTVNGTSIALGASGTVTAAAGTLTGTTLNATVVTSSLTAVGTIGTGVWQGTAVALGFGGSGQTTALAARASSGFNIDQQSTTGDAIVTIAATTRTQATTTTLSASRAWTLPAASSLNAGQHLVISDKAGAINGSNTIVVTRAGSDTINGATTITMSSQYQVLDLISDGVSVWTFNATGGGGGSGTVTTVTPGSGIVTSVTASCSQTAITSSGTLYKAECTNAQTGTSYAIVDGDRAKLITAVNAAAQAYSIAQAGAASAFQTGWYVDLKNNSTNVAGIVTITPTTSTINGASTLVLQPGQSARIVSDGTNYQTVFNSNNTAQTSCTITDASGAGLSITTNSCTYSVANGVVSLFASITYPSTADVSTAKISVPVAVPNKTYAASSTLGTSSVTLGSVTKTFQLTGNANTSNATIYNILNGNAFNNASIATSTLVFAFVYPSN